MIAYAALDIHDGHVVQLVGGDTPDARVVRADPVALATQWADAGFAALHIVDLDAALGTGNNRDLVAAAVKAVQIPVQVGGGVRNEADVAYWIDAGAAQIIIGTRALEDRAWLRNVAARHPGQVLVAADVHDGLAVTHRSRAIVSVPVTEYVAELNEVALGGVLITDTRREGRLAGADVALFESVVRVSTHPVIASGGITNATDVRALADAGMAGVILGMALYSGHIDPVSVAREYQR